MSYQNPLVAGPRAPTRSGHIDLESFTLPAVNVLPATGLLYEIIRGPNGRLYSWDGLAWVEISGAGTTGGVSQRFTQVLHGFDIGDPIRLLGTVWVLAQANTAANAEAAGLVSEVPSANEFVVTYLGPISGIPLTLVPGEVYFLDDVVAGNLILTAPTTVGTVNKPMLLALGTNAGLVMQSRGIINSDSTPIPSGGTTKLVAYNAGSPVALGTLPAGQALHSIAVRIVTPWNGVGAAVSVGLAVDPERYIAAADIDLTLSAVFTSQCYDVGPLPLVVTVAPGSGATTGQVLVQIVTTVVGP